MPVAGLALGILVVAFVMVQRGWTMRTAAVNLLSNILVCVPRLAADHA